MKLAALIIVFFPLFSKAQGILTVSKTTAQTYTGTIGQKQIRMNLSITGSQVSGFYHYSRTGTPMEVKGTINNDKISLTINPMYVVQDEINKAEGMLSAGHIEASEDPNGTVSGTARFESNAPYHVLIKKIFEVNYVDTSLNAAYRNQDPASKIDTVYTLSLSEPQFLDLPYRKKLKYINFWYSYRLLSLVNKNNYQDLNNIGAQKLDEAGFPDGKDLMDQVKTFKHTQFPYHYRNAYSVAYIDPHFLSMKSDVYVYDGAPHAFTNETYKNYDLITGDSLKLDSLFITGGKRYLDSVGEICFKRQNGMSPDANLALAGYYWNDSMFHVNNNFYFGIDGIWFVYNAYEIASYNLGITRVYIPFDMIRPIIWRKGPLGWVLKE